jgi:hypothetical protein
MVGKNYCNISQVSHCLTNPDAIRRLAETTSIFLKCPTVTQITNCYEVKQTERTAQIFIRCLTATQILMQEEGWQKLLQSFSGVTLAHKT